MFKASLIIYRKRVICELVMGSNNILRKEPVMEYCILIVFAFGIDLLLVLWVENNQVLQTFWQLHKDYIFVVIVYIIGVVILLNTFRTRDWIRAFYKGRAIVFYDLTFVTLICFIFYVVPNIAEALRDEY